MDQFERQLQEYTCIVYVYVRVCILCIYIEYIYLYVIYLYVKSKVCPISSLKSVFETAPFV